MSEVIQTIVQGLQASVKQSPYVWCAAVLTFLIGAQLALAVSIAHGDEETVRRQLNNLHQIDYIPHNTTDEKKSRDSITQDSKEELVQRLSMITPVASCAAIKVDLEQYPEAQTYDSSYFLAVDSGKTDEKGFVIWTSMSQQTKPVLSKVKTELWLPRSNADENDPLVQSGGCIIMSFPDPITPTWMRYFVGFTGNRLKTPQAACILPLQPTTADIHDHKIKTRPLSIDGEVGKGLNMEGLPAVSDVLPKLKVFVSQPERQKITIFRRS
ncbi:molybdopterin cofactor [Fusarium heterosporum]|uniref:Molybdopterin cofactor n=1 Tax=Fusarium heterosporum TaxID=42747 RepID=A0A8H5SV52_FUSHE|nr:molybdopterin cofactor [Fusarium heterosporum]